MSMMSVPCPGCKNGEIDVEPYTLVKGHSVRCPSCGVELTLSPDSIDSLKNEMVANQDLLSSLTRRKDE